LDPPLETEEGRNAEVREAEQQELEALRPGKIDRELQPAGNGDESTGRWISPPVCGCQKEERLETATTTGHNRLPRRAAAVE
jgi:hypothetical protein